MEEDLQRPPGGSNPRGPTRRRNFDMWYTTRMESSFHGYVSNTRDALLLFESARRGLIPKSPRRLKEEESKLLRSGQVFIFDEKESGIKRWTDGLIWSPSRVLSNFLVYRQVDKKLDAETTESHPLMQLAASPSIVNTCPPNPIGQKEGQGGGGQAGHALTNNTHISSVGKSSPSTPTCLSGSTLLPQMNHSITSSTGNENVHSQFSSQWTNHDSPIRDPPDSRWSGQETSLVTRKNENESERGLVGSLRGSHLFAKGGLCKKVSSAFPMDGSLSIDASSCLLYLPLHGLTQTISVRLDSTTLHLVAYFTVADVRSGCLATPSSLPQYASLSFSLDRFHVSSFRFPPKVVQTHIGGATMVFEDDHDSPSGFEEEEEHHQHYTPVRKAPPQLSSPPDLVQHQIYLMREIAGGGTSSSAVSASQYPEMLDTLAASTPFQNVNNIERAVPSAHTAGQGFYPTSTGSQHVQYTNSPYTQMQIGKGIEEADTRQWLQHYQNGQQIHRQYSLVETNQRWKGSRLTEPGVHHQQQLRNTLVNQHPYLVQSDATGLPSEPHYRPPHFLLGHQAQLVEDLQPPRRMPETGELQQPVGTVNQINLDESNRNQAYPGMAMEHDDTSGRQPFLAPSLSHESSTFSTDSPPPYWLDDDTSVQQSQARFTHGSSEALIAPSTTPSKSISSSSPSQMSTMAPPIMTSQQGQMMISTLPVQPAGLISAFSSGWAAESATAAAAFTDSGPAYYAVPMSYPNDRSDQSYGPAG